MDGWLMDDPGNRRALDELVEALRPGAALALVGAGSSARVGYPLWTGLLDRMAARIVEDDPLAQPKIDALAAEADLLWKAEEYRRLLGADRYAELLRALFGPEEAAFDELHRDLVALPFRHVLTTNYDAVLEQAHAAVFHRSRALAVCWSEAANLRDLIQRIGDAQFGRRYVYLHGRFDNPDSIVLTERDYTERYVRASDTWPRLFALLAAQRVVSIGFSLSDLDLMGMFRAVKAHMGPGEPRHFAILPHDAEKETGTTRQRLQGKYGVQPVFYRWSERHEGLHAVVRALRAALGPERPAAPGSSAPPPGRASAPPPAALAPTAGYDPDCYVKHGDLERRTLAGLSDAGSPVVLLGPARSGKTAVLRHVLDAALRDDAAAGKQSRAVLVELAAFGPEAQDSYEDFLHELASRVVEGVEGDDAWTAEAWARPLTPARRLSWLLKHHVLHRVTGRLILAIESADQLPRFNFWENVLGLLRSWAQESNTPPWDRLRIAIAVSTEPTLLKEEIHRSPFFNAALLVRLDDLGEAQVRELQALYRLPWTDEERALLTGLVGGHPYLLRVAMYEAALHGASVRALVEGAASGGGVYADFLGQLRRKLSPELLEALCGLLADGGAELHPDVEDRLRGAGLLRGGPGAHQIRYPLYEGYFRGVCDRCL
ncbi:AAA-like domain-containing protein [Sorangium sp. So ce1036]|uniref:AAA-like domain-containing protein n=1 Tax=Sorangium sp. So ce1036 TaxID=3133328 RepID=UPI003F00C74E